VIEIWLISIMHAGVQMNTLFSGNFKTNLRYEEI